MQVIGDPFAFRKAVKITNRIHVQIKNAEKLLRHSMSSIRTGWWKPYGIESCMLLANTVLYICNKTGSK